MIIPFQYTLISWSPPRLTEIEELELGQQIAIEGREKWVSEFKKSAGRVKPKKSDNKPMASLLAIGFLIGCVWVIVDAGMFPQCAVLVAVVVGIYFVSLHFATRRFEKWVDRLVGKYAAYIARGDANKGN
jgi:Flp pilus assembly protein TadB